MTRVLILGGYGGFGARIARRLARAGHEVLVAGRDRGKAEAFCVGSPNLVPLALDRDAGLADALARHRPFVLVDASGPFQGATYAVAHACVASGVHYLDIADGRDFVAGITALDAEARAAGVAVISGASSVPALSGAAIRALAEGCERVHAVEIAISASNRATAGTSVTRAILSYVGRPIRLWRGGRWTIGHGWGEPRRERFNLGGVDQLGPRIVALADVPDLGSLPDRLPGRPAVMFRAGTELALNNLALWTLSWLVRARLISSLDALASPLISLQSLISRAGSDRSGMVARLFGRAAGRRVERRWTLVADHGVGPEIPALSVPILIDRIVSGGLAAGARDAGEILSLSDFGPAFDELAIRREIVEIACPPPLYAGVIGERFDALPTAVRDMHDVLRDSSAVGHASVTRGRGWVSGLVARWFNLPAAGECDLRVSFAERDGVETWTRDFSGKAFSSQLSRSGARLVERFGPIRFLFDLPSDAKGLEMRMTGWRLGPLPLPLALAPRSVAREWEQDGRFWFDVTIALPLFGELVRYRGWLKPER